MQIMKKQRAITLAVASAALMLGALGGCGKTEDTATLIAEAKAFQQKGDTKAAVIQLKNAVVKSPDNAEARLLLANLYLDSGDAVSAEKEIRKALSLGANADQQRPALLKALAGQGQFDKVITESADAKSLEDPQVQVQRGDAYLALGQADPALQAYQKALTLKPGMAEALLGKGRVALVSGKPDETAAAIEEAIKASPKNVDSWMFKGDFTRAIGKTDEALAAYDEVLKLRPDHRSAHIEKAYVLTSTGKYDAAKAELELARKNAPASLMLTYNQAVLDYAQGKHAASKESLQKILKVAPDHMPTVLLSGAVDFALNSMPQAEQHLKKYVLANPRNLHARKLLATTYLKLGQTSDAIATLTPVADVAATDPQLLALFGEANMQARQLDKAADYFEKAAKLAPKAAVLRTSLGMTRLAQGDDARAITELELSTQLDNKSTKAATMLVLTELKRKNYDKALAAAKSLETSLPTDPMVHNLKGGVYLGMGDLVNAKAAFEKALALQPGFYPAVGNLVQMAMASKNPDQAKKLLSDFLAKDKKNVEAINAMASLAMSQNAPEEATRWLETAVAENPDATAPAVTLGAHYQRLGQKDKALSLVRKYNASHPKSPEVLNLLGQIQLESQDYNGALESFSKLTGLMPAAPQPHLRLAQVHLGLKNEAAAADDLKKALSLQPDFLDAQVATVELQVRRGQHAAALATAQQIQKQRPTEPAGFVVEGNIHRVQGKSALALKAFEQALALRKNAPNMMLVHNSMVASGKAKEAEARLAQWHKDNPNDMALTMYVAETMLTAKQYKAAIAKLEAVQKQAPNNAGVLNNLAWAYQQEKDPRAMKTAEQAYKLAGNSAPVMDTYAWMLVEQGDVARGLPILRQAAAAAPDALDIQYHLAAALHKSGDKAGARKELERIVGSGKEFAQLEQAKALLKQL